LSYGKIRFGIKELTDATFIEKNNKTLNISPMLANTLDKGEASVIQYALDNNINIVSIDETIGRRIARLNNLKLTGSLGILLKAKKQGFDINITKAVQNMKQKNIYLSEKLIQEAIRIAEE